MKKGNVLLTITMALLCSFVLSVSVHASDGEEYITISVQAEDDNGETLLYALDTDDPAAFTTNNEFTVVSGTNHTIYVKDSAGNISSQDFLSVEPAPLLEDEGKTVNIDVVLENESDYEYEGDLLTDPAEAGQGTVYSRVETEVNDPNAQRLFYEVTTAEGEVFYLVIDQEHSTDNVYLLDQVNLSDLNALASTNEPVESSEESESLLSALSEKNDKEANLTETAIEVEKNDRNSGTTSRMVMVLAIVAIGGGVYYYLKVYKGKKDEQMDLIDAMDKEDFAVEDNTEDEDADFGLDEDYQEQTMQMLLDDGENDYYDGADIEEFELGMSEAVNNNMKLSVNNEEVELFDTYEEQESSIIYEQDYDNQVSYATSHKSDGITSMISEYGEQEEDYDEELDAPDDEEE